MKRTIPKAFAALGLMALGGLAAHYMPAISQGAGALFQAQALPVNNAPELFLSSGFGDSYEPDDLTENVDIPPGSPYVQANGEVHDPGPKPYPTSWDLSGGEIEEMSFGEYSGTKFFDLDTCGQVCNETDLDNDELLEESREAPAFSLLPTTLPQVLIMHTHTTESFEPYERDAFDDSFNYRTTDPDYNICRVGDAITAQLESEGIGVIHDTTIHDYPSYTGSYDRSRETVLDILDEYPSIKVVLDIHRDAIGGNGVLKQPTVRIDGKKAAQLMIISGCDDGTMDMPHYMDNFHFACALQQQMEADYPGLTRPILFDYRHYNQDLTTGSLLIEVGTHGNTIEQVEYTGELLGKSLSRLLRSMTEGVHES